LIYYSKSALHVSGEVYAHWGLVAGVSNALHFETPAGSSLDEHYQILQIQSSAPDNGRKRRPKHVELTWNNKSIYIVHLVGYFYSCITMREFTNLKFIVLRYK